MRVFGGVQSKSGNGSKNAYSSQQLYWYVCKGSTLLAAVSRNPLFIQFSIYSHYLTGWVLPKTLEHLWEDWTLRQNLNQD
jgi:hypothetical protein